MKTSRKKTGAEEILLTFLGQEFLASRKPFISRHYFRVVNRVRRHFNLSFHLNSNSRASATLSLPNGARYPGVKVEKNYAFDSPNAKNSRRPVRRQKPAHRLSLHVRPGLEGGLPSCSFNMDHTAGAFGATRSLSQWFHERPRPKSKSLRSAGMAICLGLVVRDRHQLRRPHLLHKGGTGQRQNRIQLRFGGIPSAEAPGISVFYWDESGAI